MSSLILYKSSLSCRPLCSGDGIFLFESSPFPDQINGRVDGELQDLGGDDPADHGCGDPFHDIGACAVAEHDRDQAREDDPHGHEFGPDPFDRAVQDGILEVALCIHPTLSFPFPARQVQIEKHDHPGLCVQPGEGDHADPDGDAHVVIEHIKKPERSHQGKGDGQEHDQGLGQGFGVEKNQDKDDHNRKRDHELQAFMGFYKVFIFSAPFEAVAVRHLQRCDPFSGLLHISAHILS